MYHCDMCGKVVKSRTKCHKMVVAQRPVKYPGGSTGIETVKEIKVCSSCASDVGPPRMEALKLSRHR